MTLYILIPVRPLQQGKTRLAGVLTQDQREALNARFFDHVLGIAIHAVGTDRCLIVSPAGVLLDLAASRGCAVVEERGDGGLNEALSLAAETARSRGATSVLSLSCDLPFLQTDDLAAIITAGEPPSLVIAPDVAGTGTNVMLMSPIAAIPYCYGADSLAVHIAAAQEAGIGISVVSRPGLAQDIDNPVDLERLRASPDWSDLFSAHGQGQPGTASLPMI